MPCGVNNYLIDMRLLLPTLQVGLRCWHKYHDREVVIVNGEPDFDGDYWVVDPHNPSWPIAVPHSWLLDMDKKPVIELK
jgi:hypothetical protein